jgi:hypothetical protein
LAIKKLTTVNIYVTINKIYGVLLTMSQEACEPELKDYLMANSPEDKLFIVKVLTSMGGYACSELDNSTFEARKQAAKLYSESIDSVADVAPGPKPEHAKKLKPKKYDINKNPIESLSGKSASYKGALRQLASGSVLLEITTCNPELAKDDFRKLHRGIKRAEHAMNSAFVKDEHGVRDIATEEDEPDI